jgi:hypothetical protein
MEWSSELYCMPPDGPTDELLHRLLIAVSSPDEAARLVARARADAAEEVGSLLKSAFKASLLRQAVEQLEGSEGAQQPKAEPLAQAQVSSPEPDPAPVVNASETLSTGCYIYAITPATPGASPPAESAIDPAFPLELIESDEIQAIVSQVSLAEFGQAALNDRVADRQWVEAKVRAHDDVVKRATSFGAVIPCRFCTIVRSREDVRALLAAHHRRIASSLASLAGRSEWGVKLAHSPQSTAQAPGENLSGRVYLQQKQHAQDRRRQREREARDRAMELHESLAATASNAAQLPLRHHTSDGAAQPLLNGAYLVADSDTARFHAAVTEWADRHAAEGWRVELTGPWPPYNFADLDLSLETAA